MTSKGAYSNAQRAKLDAEKNRVDPEREAKERAIRKQTEERKQRIANEDKRRAEEDLQRRNAILEERRKERQQYVSDARRALRVRRETMQSANSPRTTATATPELRNTPPLVEVTPVRFAETPAHNKTMSTGAPANISTTSVDSLGGTTAPTTVTSLQDLFGKESPANTAAQRDEFFFEDVSSADPFPMPTDANIDDTIDSFEDVNAPLSSFRTPRMANVGRGARLNSDPRPQAYFNVPVARKQAPRAAPAETTPVAPARAPPPVAPSPEVGTLGVGIPKKTGAKRPTQLKEPTGPVAAAAAAVAAPAPPAAGNRDFLRGLLDMGPARAQSAPLSPSKRVAPAPALDGAAPGGGGVGAPAAGRMMGGIDTEAVGRAAALAKAHSSGNMAQDAAVAAAQLHGQPQQQQPAGKKRRRTIRVQELPSGRAGARTAVEAGEDSPDRPHITPSRIPKPGGPPQVHSTPRAPASKTRPRVGKQLSDPLIDVAPPRASRSPRAVTAAKKNGDINESTEMFLYAEDLARRSGYEYSTVLHAMKRAPAGESMSDENALLQSIARLDVLLKEKKKGEVALPTVEEHYRMKNKQPEQARSVPSSAAVPERRRVGRHPDAGPQPSVRHATVVREELVELEPRPLWRDNITDAVAGRKQHAALAAVRQQPVRRDRPVTTIDAVKSDLGAVSRHDKTPTHLNTPDDRPVRTSPGLTRPRDGAAVSMMPHHAALATPAQPPPGWVPRRPTHVNPIGGGKDAGGLVGGAAGGGRIILTERAALLLASLDDTPKQKAVTPGGQRGTPREADAMAFRANVAPRPVLPRSPMVETEPVIRLKPHDRPPTMQARYEEAATPSDGSSPRYPHAAQPTSARRGPPVRTPGSARTGPGGTPQLEYAMPQRSRYEAEPAPPVVPPLATSMRQQPVNRVREMNGADRAVSAPNFDISPDMSTPRDEHAPDLYNSALDRARTLLRLAPLDTSRDFDEEDELDEEDDEAPQRIADDGEDSEREAEREAPMPPPRSVARQPSGRVAPVESELVGGSEWARPPPMNDYGDEAEDVEDEEEEENAAAVMAMRRAQAQAQASPMKGRAGVGRAEARAAPPPVGASALRAAMAGGAVDVRGAPQRSPAPNHAPLRSSPAPPARVPSRRAQEEDYEVDGDDDEGDRLPDDSLDSSED